MKIFRSANPSPLNSIVTLVVGIFLLTACGIFSPGGGGGQNTQGVGWRVWIRTEPCAGRFDWLSVAKEKGGAGTGSGLASYVLYDTYLGAPAGFKSCTLPEPNGCTFAEATALMEALRPHPRFSNFCCRDFSVWRNSSTGALSVVVGKYSTGGFGWILEKADLCCEEAEALAGIPGACSGGSQAPPLGPVVRRTPRITNTNTTIVGNDGETNNNGGEVVTNTPIVIPTQPPPPPPPPVTIPNVMKECEGVGAMACGTWTRQGNQFQASWENGAKAMLVIEQFDNNQVIITRNDTADSFSKNLSARYTGKLSGNSIVDGKVTWTQNGRTWSGTWSANW